MIKHRIIYKTLFFLAITIIPILTFGQQPHFSLPDYVDDGDFINGRVIFKVDKKTGDFIKSKDEMPKKLEQVFEKIEGTNIRRGFPTHSPPENKFHETGQPLVDLSRIYYMDIPKEEDIENAINELYNTGLMEYVQPHYIPQLLQHVPNDPLINNQYYLEKIQAFDAWEISVGDTNTVIGIVDTGTDLYHPDLINSIKYNYDDPINGQDSDNDGFVDNFYGWDLGEGNNMPQYNSSGHGLHVSGISSATADNGTGIAGTGYKSKFLPVKVDDEYGSLTMAYEGIVYAADRGASVINCSWGRFINPGPYALDIINYAIFNRDVLVVAAAGNSNNDRPIYPAAFENVFSVAATDENDIKAGFSSYGITVDISAPGNNIFSTWQNGSYVASGGTSTAAPVVSGAAAILRSYFHDYNALQIAQLMKVTADNIYEISENSDYKELLGAGRLNLYRALTESHNPAIKLTAHGHSPEEYTLYRANDIMEITGTFTNFLAHSDNIEVELYSSSPYIEILSNIFNTGEIGTMESLTNDSQPFEVHLNENIPINHQIDFELRFTDNNDYKAKQYFTIFVNIDYININVNRIATSLTSRGTLGYNYPNYQQGLGFLFDSGFSMIKCAGLIAGKSPSNVVDNIYGPAEGSFNELFIPVENIRKVENTNIADYEFKGIFKDDPEYQYNLDIKIEQYAYAWEEEPNDNFIILEYDIINTGENDITSFYTGFFADWQIRDNKQHRATFDHETKMGYAYSATGGFYKGISLISDGNFIHYAFDNEGFGGSININSGFTGFEKYTALKSNRSSAGFYDADNDISTLVSTGPYALSPGDTVNVVFGILAGNHLENLKNTAKKAYELYHKIDDDNNGINYINQTNNQVQNFKVYPVPFKDNINVDFYAKTPGNYTIKLFDIQGRLIKILHDEFLKTGDYNMNFDIPQTNNKTYIIQLRNKDRVSNHLLIRENKTLE